jgi:hypothetical protein
MSDPFGRAIRDHHRGEREEPLVQRDGDWAREHPIERFYFSSFTGESDGERWLESRLDGPLLDLGAGAGRHALYFQERSETVAVEVSDHLVETMADRGVEDARRGDMFALREQFDRDRFRSALAIGTQLGLAGSMDGIRRFLNDLAYVTTPDATAVVDCYDPERVASGEGDESGEGDGGSGGEEREANGMLGFRDDPAPGLASRVMHFEYEGDVSETLLFRLFGPDRLREAAVPTGWSVAEVRYGDEETPHYRAALAKD